MIFIGAVHIEVTQARDLSCRSFSSTHMSNIHLENPYLLSGLSFGVSSSASENPGCRRRRQPPRRHTQTALPRLAGPLAQQDGEIDIVGQQVVHVGLGGVGAGAQMHHGGDGLCLRVFIEKVRAAPCSARSGCSAARQYFSICPARPGGRKNKIASARAVECTGNSTADKTGGTRYKYHDGSPLLVMNFRTAPLNPSAASCMTMWPAFAKAMKSPCGNFYCQRSRTFPSGGVIVS